MNYLKKHPMIWFWLTLFCLALQILFVMLITYSWHWDSETSSLIYPNYYIIRGIFIFSFYIGPIIALISFIKNSGLLVRVLSFTFGAVPLLWVLYVRLKYAGI